MKSRLAIVLLGLTAFTAHAEIYKSIDGNGHVTYSNIPSRGAKKLNIEPLTTLPKPQPRLDSDLRVDRHTQKMRDETRYSILKEELSAEESRLSESRQALQGAGGDREQAKKSREDMILHEKNIEALKREISNLK